VKGSTGNRDRFFLGFNTPYRPEVLIATQVGQEGIDLHRECRHVIHHDLWWNPAVVEQRTGRVDRIGSKVERERNAQGGRAATLDVAVPYLAATYDERVFEEVHRRAELFEVTMGGEIQVGHKTAGPELDSDRRNAEGIDAEGEELGFAGETNGIALPTNTVDRLRVDLAVWRKG
jgi:superfamily II DNA/RNA helicase